MNYKNACLNNQSTIAVKKPTIKAKPAADEKAKFNRSCARAVDILYLRWTKYKEDYIALHGEDEYERMYLTPNYWVMPEEEEVEESSSSEEEVEYYSS